MNQELPITNFIDLDSLECSSKDVTSSVSSVAYSSSSIDFNKNCTSSSSVSSITNTVSSSQLNTSSISAISSTTSKSSNETSSVSSVITQQVLS